MKHRNLFCSSCDTFTKHKVEDKPDASIQNIICIECGDSMTHHMVSNKVKVEKRFWDEYIRRKRARRREN